MGLDRSSHASPRQHYRPGTARHRGVSKVRKVKAHSSGRTNYCKSSYTSYCGLRMIAHLSSLNMYMSCLTHWRFMDWRWACSAWSLRFVKNQDSSRNCVRAGDAERCVGMASLSVGRSGVRSYESNG